jgi:hypothetical protein
VRVYFFRHCLVEIAACLLTSLPKQRAAGPKIRIRSLLLWALSVKGKRLRTQFGVFVG